MQSKFFLCETYRRPKSQRQMDQNRGKRAHFEARGRDKFCCVDLIGGSWRSWIYKTPINPHTLNSASFRQECNTTKSSQILWEEKRFVILLLCSKVVILNLRILHIYLNLSNAAYPFTINSILNCSRCQEHLKHVSFANNRAGSVCTCSQIAIWTNNNTL